MAYADPTGTIETAGETNVPVPAASITKAMVAALVVMVSVEGDLDLQRPLTDALPFDVRWERNPTWLQALTHTGGFPFELQRNWWWDKASPSNADLAAAMRQLELLPTVGWHYSNAGYQVIAAGLEAVTSQPWDRLAGECLWTPAGMLSTGLPEESSNATSSYAAGGVQTTLVDLCRFGSILAGHRPDLLPPSSLRILTQPVAMAGPRLIQAPGVQLSVDGRTRILTWGTISKTTIGLIVEPGMHSVAVTIGALAAGDRLRDELTDVSDRLRPGMITSGLGLWWFDGEQVEVDLVGDNLVARAPQSPTLLARVPMQDAQIEEGHIQLPGLTLWRDMEDSPW